MKLHCPNCYTILPGGDEATLRRNARSPCHGCNITFPFENYVSTAQGLARLAGTMRYKLARRLLKGIRK